MVAGESFHRGNEPKQKLIVRLERRTGGAGAVPARLRFGILLLGRAATPLGASGTGERNFDQGGSAPLEPPGGKEVRIHGLSVLAARKPMSMFRTSAVIPIRFPERRLHALTYQEPPRKTRFAQSPRCQALPSVGVPA